ncbi:MAG: A24 family peptidase [Myxococcaceae bacterium]
MPPVQIALWTILGVALLISVVTDVLGGRIFDVVTYPAMVGALMVRWVVEGLGDSERGLVSGVIGLVGAMALFGVLAWRGKMGWGDVKLMGAVGAAFGFPLVLAAVVFISLAGSVQAALTLLVQGHLRETLAASGRRWAQRLGLVPRGDSPGARRHIPYGVAIAFGCAWAMWWEAA